MVLNDLSGHINHIKMNSEITEIMVRQNENVIFHEHFLNIDISLTVSYKPFKFSRCIYEIQMQRSFSQFCYLGPSFDFMKCRN